MGRVLTPLQVRKKDVPVVADFAKVQAVLAEQIQAFSWVKAAIFYGSIIKSRDVDIFSDIDVVIVFEEDKFQSAERGWYEMNRYCNSHNIPLNLIMTTPEALRIRQYDSIDVGLALHLQWAIRQSGSQIKGNVLDFLNLDADNQQNDSLAYLHRKAQRVIRMGGTLKDYQDRFKLLQWLLDTPIHIARRTLSCYDLLDGEDGKFAVAERYLTHFPEEGNILERILDLQAKYKAQAWKSLNHWQAYGYEKILLQLEANRYLLYEMIRKNQALIRAI